MSFGIGCRASLVRLRACPNPARGVQRCVQRDSAPRVYLAVWRGHSCTARLIRMVAMSCNARTGALGLARPARVSRMAGLWLATAAIACVRPNVGRIGPVLALPTGQPRSVCERQGWYELAPARVRATGATVGVMFGAPYTYTVPHSQLQEGIGAFEHASDDPEELEDIWSKLDEPELERRHQSRIEPVDAAFRRTLYWSLGGLGAMGAGVGTAAVIQDDSPTAAAVFGLSGVVVGLVGAVAALASQPSGDDQVYADARRRLFIPGEDDLLAAQRGIDRANARRRRECGGAPDLTRRQSARPHAVAPPPPSRAVPALVPSGEMHRE